MNVVFNKLVFRVKYKPDGFVDRFKARLVAKGVQQTPGLDFFETFSPVIKPATIRVVFTLAVTFGWDIQQVNVNDSFLNGDFKRLFFCISQKDLRVLSTLIMFAGFIRCFMV